MKSLVLGVFVILISNYSDAGTCEFYDYNQRPRIKSVEATFQSCINQYQVRPNLQDSRVWVSYKGLYFGVLAQQGILPKPKPKPESRSESRLSRWFGLEPVTYEISSCIVAAHYNPAPFYSFKEVQKTQASDELDCLQKAFEIMPVQMGMHRSHPTFGIIFIGQKNGEIYQFKFTLSTQIKDPSIFRETVLAQLRVK